MMHAEVCRHAANVAELACAAANPVKKRHFYLVMKGEFNAAATTGEQATDLPLQTETVYGGYENDFESLNSIPGSLALISSQVSQQRMLPIQDCCTVETMPAWSLQSRLRQQSCASPEGLPQSARRSTSQPGRLWASESPLAT